MKNIRYRAGAAAALVFLLLLMTALTGCGRGDAGTQPGGSETAEMLSDEQVLSAIRNYCFISNPSLQDIIDAGEYPVYWDIGPGGEREAVVLFRSYTGAQERYYVDLISGETYVTECVPGVTDEEARTGESFNVKDYLDIIPGSEPSR